MSFISNPDTVRELQNMREKWRKGTVSTKEYHEFIEHTKNSIKVSDEAYRFF